MSVKKFEYNGKEFIVPELSNDGFHFPETTETQNGLCFVREPFDKIWNLREFDFMHIPLFIKEQKFPEFSGIRVLDLPIKFPGTNYRIPNELSGYSSIIQEAISNHARLVNNGSQYHAYLTIDESIVEPSATARHGGCHVDGFQGARIRHKVFPDNSIIMIDSLPTEFFYGPFPCSHLNTKRDNFFEHFDKLATDMAPKPIKTNSLYLMDAYTVHRAGKNTSNAPVKRKFFRLSYSVRQFDRLGNTHNPMFDYEWPMVARDFKQTLSA